ncbi:hypothetical protein BH11MYX1_BH11MYX1_22860 [soil metagenome]
MHVVRLPRLSRAVKTALVMALSVAYVGWHAQGAYAKGGGDDESGDDDGGDDDGGGGKGDKGDAGGDDDDDGNADGSDQPSVYAGGLYTINTYPVRENSRPLTITKGVTQIRLGIGTDLSAKGAFESFGVNLEAQYGYSDNFSLIGGLTDAYNFKQYSAYFGFEGALAYDLLDIRLAANLHRNAVALYADFCNPPTVPGEIATGSPGAEVCQSSSSAIENLPSGKFDKGGTKFSIDLGFPFRYSIKPEIAIIALQTLISIDFNAVAVDHASVVPVDPPVTGQPATTFRKTGNSAKPDLNPSIGVATNPIPQLSVVIYAQLRIPDFDTSAGQFQVPVTARIEASPSQKLDFGLEFTLLNVKPPDGQSPIDNRYLSLFAQARY